MVAAVVFYGWALLLVLAAATSVVSMRGVEEESPTLPGVKVTLTSRGLAYAAAEGLTYLQTQLAGISIQVPSQSGEKDTIEWTISRIQIQDIKVPGLTAQYVAGSGLKLSVHGISAQVTADWSGREKLWPHPSGSGKAQIDVSSVSGMVDVQVVASHGRPLVKDLATSLSIAGFDLHFSGSHLDFLLDLLKNLFAGKVRDAVNSAIQRAIGEEINQGLNAIFQSLPDAILVSPGVSLNYSLISNELFTPSTMTLNSLGAFNSAAHPWPFPFSPGALPDTVNQTSASMAQVVVGEYVLKTAAYTYFKSELLRVVLDPSIVPPESPIQLNTSSWGALVPQLPKLYPGWAMKVVVYATAAPTLGLVPTGVKGHIAGAMDFEVVSPSNNSVLPAFTMAFNASAAGEASVSAQGNLTGQFTAFSTNFWLASSRVAAFDPTALAQLLTFAVQGVGVPYLNSLLSVGLPLPSFDSFRLVNPQTVYGTGYLYVLTDIKC